MIIHRIRRKTKDERNTSNRKWPFAGQNDIEKNLWIPWSQIKKTKNRTGLDKYITRLGVVEMNRLTVDKTQTNIIESIGIQKIMQRWHQPVWINRSKTSEAITVHPRHSSDTTGEMYCSAPQTGSRSSLGGRDHITEGPWNIYFIQTIFFRALLSLKKIKN